VNDPVQTADCYQRAIHLGIRTVEIHVALGYVLQKLGRLDEAIGSHEEALRIDPESAHPYIGIAAVHKARDNYPSAIEYYQRALQLDPDNTEVRHMLASMGAAPVPKAAAAEYVSNLFDQFADHFDKSLLVELEYRTPEHLNQALRRVAGIAERPLDVMDLGCGTGLCGPRLKDLARTLTGVDLSPKMIDKARARGVYDRLVVGDIVEELAAPGVSCDLVIAADVFVYLGDLQPVFEACKLALKPGGLFAFSLEAEECDSYVLRSSGRYAHSAGYIRKLAREHGLQEVSLDQVVLRKEKGSPMPGYVFVLRR